MPVLRTCRWCCDMADFKQTTLTTNQRDGFGMPLAYTNQKNRPFGLPLVCEAFHFAPSLFFMFLFTFTIRQQCLIYPQEFSTEPLKSLIW